MNATSRSWPSASSTMACIARHGSRPAPTRPDSRARAMRGGRGEAAVAAEELEPVAADGALLLAAVEERDPRRELAAVGVAREQARLSWGRSR